MLYEPTLYIASGNIKVTVKTLFWVVTLSSMLSFCTADSINLTIHQGCDFIFNCCAETNNSIKSFVVEHPNGKPYLVVTGRPFENERISASISDNCEVKVKEAYHEDNGIWNCTVFVHDENSNSSFALKRKINVASSEPEDRNGVPDWAPFLLIFGIFCFVLCVVVACANKNSCRGNQNNNDAANFGENIAMNPLGALSNNQK